MGTNLFLSIFLVGVLQLLWGLVNTLQIIMLSVLLTVDMPLNCYQIMIAIMRLTNLDVVDTEDFLTKFFTFKSEALPRNMIFKEAGYETSNFIIELGLIFIIIVVFILLATMRMCLIMTMKKCCGSLG